MANKVPDSEKEGGDPGLRGADVAVRAYRQRRVSLGRAVEMSGVPRVEVERRMAELGIERDYAIEDLGADLRWARGEAGSSSGPDRGQKTDEGEIGDISEGDGFERDFILVVEEGEAEAGFAEFAGGAALGGNEGVDAADGIGDDGLHGAGAVG